MTKQSRPSVTYIVYGLFEGGYGVRVFVNGALYAYGRAADLMEGHGLARRIKRLVKRRMRRHGNALPATGTVYTVRSAELSR